MRSRPRSRHSMPRSASRRWSPATTCPVDLGPARVFEEGIHAVAARGGRGRHRETGPGQDRPRPWSRLRPEEAGPRAGRTRLVGVPLQQQRKQPRAVEGHRRLSLQQELLHRHVVRRAGALEQDARRPQVGDRLECLEPLRAVVADLALDRPFSAKAIGSPERSAIIGSSHVTRIWLKKTSPEQWTSGATPSAASGSTIALRSRSTSGGLREARSSSALL